MQGKKIIEKLKILDGEEELWLTYATEEEVQEFRNAASMLSPEYHKYFQYLFERAQAHEKWFNPKKSRFPACQANGSCCFK